MTPPTSADWIAIHRQLLAIHLAKSVTYGNAADPFANVTASSACGVEPWRRALCDLSDCVVRMQRFAHGQEVDYENALVDAANWAMICLAFLRAETLHAVRK